MLNYAVWIASHSSVVFVGAASQVQMDLSTTSHKCLIGFMSGECSGQTIRRNVGMFLKPILDNLARIARCLILLKYPIIVGVTCGHCTGGGNALCDTL